MNPTLTSDLATSKSRDLQHAAQRHHAHSGHRDPVTRSSGYRPSVLRRRIGFTLVEAGLLLLAAPTRAGDHRYLPS